MEKYKMYYCDHSHRMGNCVVFLGDLLLDRMIYTQNMSSLLKPIFHHPLPREDKHFIWCLIRLMGIPKTPPTCRIYELQHTLYLPTRHFPQKCSLPNSDGVLPLRVQVVVRPKVLRWTCRKLDASGPTQAKFDVSMSSSGQANKVVVFRLAEYVFESFHRRSTFSSGSSLLTEGFFLRRWCILKFHQ